MDNRKIRNSRKVLLFLPVLILPFAALAFYAMGGGSGAPGITRQAGINTTLPDAAFSKQKPGDKMGIYDQSDQDSARMGSSGLDQIAERLGFHPEAKDDPAAEIELKLQALHQQLNAPLQSSPEVNQSSRPVRFSARNAEVDRLETLMSGMQGNSNDDAEMKQLSGMLEKVLDIQHPQRVRDAYLEKVNAAPEERFKAIPAMIAKKQTLVQGAVLKLVLSDTVSISGVRFPKGQEIFGLCNLTNQRLLVDIKTIRMDNHIIPVDLSLYSLDGIKGMEAPDAIVNSALSGGADDALNSLQLLGMDQSVGVQVAGAGIDAAKGLFSKKVRQVRIRLKAGEKVLLRNNKKVR